MEGIGRRELQGGTKRKEEGREGFSFREKMDESVLQK
jgi:hypothetical protein